MGVLQKIWFQITDTLYGAWLVIEMKFLKALISVLPKNEVDPLTCEHEWHVESTALNQVCLELTCYKCNSYGTVNDPTSEEWADAYHAPSNPYLWIDADRVTYVSQWNL